MSLTPKRTHDGRHSPAPRDPDVSAVRLVIAAKAHVWMPARPAPGEPQRCACGHVRTPRRPSAENPNRYAYTLRGKPVELPERCGAYGPPTRKADPGKPRAQCRTEGCTNPRQSPKNGRCSTCRKIARALGKGAA